jgi:hypothetical protein
MASRRMTWNVVRGSSGCRPACVRRRHLHEGTEQLAERDASDTRILVRTVVDLMLDGPLVPGGVPRSCGTSSSAAGPLPSSRPCRSFPGSGIPGTTACSAPRKRPSVSVAWRKPGENGHRFATATLPPLARSSKRPWYGRQRPCSELVETSGLEPPTPCLQSRCSTN